MGKKGSIYTGTSGWHYQHWKGPFYPRELPDKQMLSYYAGRFNSAEINNTFYQLPAESTFKVWHDTVPANFVFTVKASRYITHMKKLKEGEKTLTALFERLKLLEGKLGPVLFQLPPRWKVNTERLREFIYQLPCGFKYTFEFRDKSWFNEEVNAILREKRDAFCIYDLAGDESPHTITGDLIYIRLHGPSGAYQGRYSDEALDRWASEISRWSVEGKEVYCFFDNDEHGYAALNALKMRDILGQTEK